MDTIIGFLGVGLGLFVAPAQLVRILKTKEVEGISLCTYIFLVLALFCYLIHAIAINDPVFITAQSINIISNIIVLFFIIKYGKK